MPGPRSTREYYFDHRRPRSTCSPVPARRRAKGEPTPDDGYGGDYIHGTSPPGRRGGRTSLDAARRRRAGGVPGGRRRHDVRGDQESAPRLPVPLRRLLLTRDPLHEQATTSSAALAGSATSDTSTRRTAPLAADHRDVGDDKDRVADPVHGDGAYLLRQRPRLLPRQAGSAASTGCSIIARRRPPRLRRPDDGDVALPPATSRTSEHRDPDRPAGQPPQGRRAAPAVQAGRRPSSPSTTWSRLIGVDACATRWPATAATARRHRSSTSWSHPQSPTTTRSSRCSTPTPGSRACSATRPTSASWPSRTRSCSPTRRRVSCCARSAEFPRVVPGGRRCASRTGWRATSRSSPGSTTGSTTTAGCCRGATRRSATSTARG